MFGGGPAYFSGPNGQTIFYCGNGRGFVAGSSTLGLIGLLSAFTLTGSKLMNSQPPSKQTFPGLGGTTPIVTSNNGENGIVWAVVRSDPSKPDATGNTQFGLRLRAFEAISLPVELFEADCGLWDSIYQHYATFALPPLPAFSGYSDPMKPNLTNPGNTLSFTTAGAALIEPMVINGKVYVGSDRTVTVFGQ